MNVLKINVIQSFRFNMNPKLTDVTLNCTVFLINVNITDFAGENYIRIGRNTHQSYNLVFKIVLKIVTIFKIVTVDSYVVVLGVLFENLSIPKWTLL